LAVEASIFGDAMKRISALLLLAVLSLAWAMPAQAQIFTGPDAARQAEKAGKKQQKAANKATVKKERALQKAAKKQQKAVKKSEKAQPRA
jgi:hypothetical protein